MHLWLDDIRGVDLIKFNFRLFNLLNINFKLRILGFLNWILADLGIIRASHAWEWLLVLDNALGVILQLDSLILIHRYRAKGVGRNGSIINLNVLLALGLGCDEPHIFGQLFLRHLGHNLKFN